jgi:transposase-like protein
VKTAALKRKNGKLGRRAVLRSFSPEQKRQRQLEIQRAWRRHNPKESRERCKVWARKNRQKARAKGKSDGIPIKFRKPLYQCALCLYQAGFTSQSIAERLHISPVNVRVIVSRSGVSGSRTPSRFSRNLGKRGPQLATAAKLIMRNLWKEQHALALFDEVNHWKTHPERVAWSNQNSRRKKNQARLAKYLSKFKCKVCGCDALALTPERRRFGIKFCSEKCSNKAQLIRSQSDPQFWQHRREIAKKCYQRTRQERPEVYKAQIRRRLANPLNRIAKNHRARIYQLVRRGLMNKTQSSTQYLGCTFAHLKQHLESKFRPGMTWENHGKVWHVDHKRPLSKFNLMNAEECIRAFNWSNLQPLFAQENLRKSGKFIDL